MSKQNTLSILIKPASSSCNLHCKYCFYVDVSEQRAIVNHGIMKKDTVDQLIHKAVEALSGNGEINFSFQGGEPTVAGLDYFIHFVEEVKKYPNVIPHYSLQTNATLIDEHWAKFFHDHQFLLGVSLDGFESNMNLFRYDQNGKSIFYKVLKGIDYLREYKVDFNILTVVTRQLAKHPKALYQFYRNHHFDYIQLIPCLPFMDSEKDEDSLTPELYASFFKEMYSLFEKDVLNNKPISINLFDNIAGMLQGYPPYQCGMLGICNIHYVVEGNGDVYPCDFYCLDKYCMGNIHSCSFKTFNETAQAKQFLSEMNCKNSLCEKCRFVNLCNGGCRRQNICYLKEDYCGYQDLLQTIIPRMQKLLR